MLVLGINGLGILPSASLVKDGKLIVFAEEERFNRLKGTQGVMPTKAVMYCLDYLGIGLKDIDYIAFGWDCNKYKYKMPFFLAWKYLTRASKNKSGSKFIKFINEISKYTPQNVSESIREMFRSLGVQGTIPPIKYISHHLSHAASTFYLSGFNNSYILVVDGSGEENATSIFKGDSGKIKHVSSVMIPDSLGWFYQSFTEFLGFKPNNHEGKLMGLAPYGKNDDEINSKVNKLLMTDLRGKYTYDATSSFFGNHDKGIVYSDKMIGIFGNPRNSRDEITQDYKNLAFGVQQKLEYVVSSIVESITQKEDFNGKLCIAGGVALNCKMNGKLLENPKINKIFVPPIASDVGTSLGAALVLSEKLGFSVNIQLESANFSSEYSDEVIEKHLKRLHLDYTICNRIEVDVAKLLSENNIVGWFQGRMEIGPRALGSRSILANPTKIEMKDRVNIKVKYRESWRPFAASILYEDRMQYVEIDHESPFMAIAFKVKQEALSKIPAAVHIDNTTRPQFVKKENHPLYWNLIQNFKQITGVGALLNTSFNLDDEPIVESPFQAIRSFYSSELDYLAIGRFLVKKNKD